MPMNNRRMDNCSVIVTGSYSIGGDSIESLALVIWLASFSK
jgi:hypothetical protein